MPKYIIETPNRGWEQNEVEADTPYEAVEKALRRFNMLVNTMEPVKPEPHEIGNYDGWLELCIRVSPPQEEAQ